MATKVLPKGDTLLPQHNVVASFIRRITEPSHPLFDPRVNEPADPKLVEAIRKDGFTSMLIVRRTDGDFYELVDGRRRHKAVLSINPEMRVLCRVIEADDETAFDRMVAANETSLPYTDMQRANLIDAALKRGRSMASVASAFGINTGVAYKLLRLLEASPEVQSAVASGALSTSAAAALATVPAEVQAATVAAGPVTARAAEKVARAWKAASPAGSGKNIPPLFQPSDEVEAIDGFATFQADDSPSAFISVPVQENPDDTAELTDTSVYPTLSDKMSEKKQVVRDKLVNPAIRCKVLDYLTGDESLRPKLRKDSTILWALLAWAATGDDGDLLIDPSGTAGNAVQIALKAI